MYGHLFESRSIRRRHWFIITDRRASFRYQSHHGPPNPKSSVSVYSHENPIVGVRIINTATKQRRSAENIRKPFTQIILFIFYFFLLFFFFVYTCIALRSAIRNTLNCVLYSPPTKFRCYCLTIRHCGII